MFYKKEKCFERVPVHWLLGTHIVNPPIWAKFVSWQHLTDFERAWFNQNYSSDKENMYLKCEEWELNIIRKLQTERDAEKFQHEILKKESMVVD